MVEKHWKREETKQWENHEAITFNSGSCLENLLSDCVERSGAGEIMKFYY